MSRESPLLSKLHNKIAGLFGYELIRRKKVGHMVAGSHLQLLLDKLQIDHVIDVGANHGQYAEELRERGYNGYILSFEPVNTNYQVLLDKSRHDDKWKVYHCALGSQSGSMMINVTRSTAFASFYKPNDYSMDRFGEKNVEVDYNENVQVKRLDEIYSGWIKQTERPRVFLKMDTQGYDLEVFKGVGNILSDILGLQSEVSVVQLYDGMPDYLESLNAFQKKGFELTGLYPVSRDHDSLAVIECDCIMRRKMN